MGYLEEFRDLLDTQSTTQFLRLWEEYALSEAVDGKELVQVLEAIHNSYLGELFGQYAETILPIWKQIDDPETAGAVLRLILDLQSTNTPLFADLATEFLKGRYGDQPNFNEKMRIVGLRGRHSFRGAIRNYELLSHMDKGKFVFHNGGWGVGEIMDISLLREHVLVEFEGISTLKDLSFENAFKNLSPLSSDHFLARRFGDPDKLEQEGKDDPLALVHLLLRDLGPKTSAELKDELAELVIPMDDWAKWWQAARSKIKKDPKIRPPKSARDPFVLLEEEISFDEQFEEVLKKATTTEKLIQETYNFTRDFPDVLKNPQIKEGLEERLREAGESFAEKLQIVFLKEDLFGGKRGELSHTFVKEFEGNALEVINGIGVVAFKKRFLAAIRDVRSDWGQFFLSLLFRVEYNPLRDYMLKELLGAAETKELVHDHLRELLHKMTLYPTAFFWYFQKLVGNEEVPYCTPDGKRDFLEAFLILLHFIENEAEYRDLTKKMHQLVIGKRYAMIRAFIEGSSREFLEEFLLLASKCHTLTKHDQKTLQALVHVVDPSIGGEKKREEEEVIWTTAEGYQKLKERIHHLGTVETVDNAKEIEAARALGDLRENSEYKFALERRARLQGELKVLSAQLNQARILTREDISCEQVGVGVIVKLLDEKGQKIAYTLLGPWDADPDKHVLSFQSKLAQAMIGHKPGEKFEFHSERFTVQEIKSYLE